MGWGGGEGAGKCKLVARKLLSLESYEQKLSFYFIFYLTFFLLSDIFHILRQLFAISLI